MEDSHYNSNYFWTPIPTMAGQFENVMFINKIKEQLMTEKSCAQAMSAASPGPQAAGPQPPSSQPAGPPSQQQQQQPPAPLQSYPAALVGSGHTDPPSGTASDGNPPPASDNVAVLPLPSSALMTGLVITSPSSSLSSSSGGLSPLAHAPPTFSLAGAPAMIVSGLAPALSGADKKGPAEEAQQAQAQAKAAGGKKRKGRPSEAALSDSEDPYAVPNDDEVGKDGKAYRCRVCPLSFLSKSEMQVHSKSHSECKPHHCPHCSKTFANTSYLAQHVRIHSGAKPYSCSFCQKTFRQLSHLQQHTR
ncbi:zinc finger protein 384-like, partial [Stegostoma tigrinum]|uniref:zinc finger protein 384-like n=1 Tax=Stegostoma tigrinum TaxID=3053191 RepID=UPI00286FFEF4